MHKDESGVEAWVKHTRNVYGGRRRVNRGARKNARTRIREETMETEATAETLVPERIDPVGAVSLTLQWVGYIDAPNVAYVGSTRCDASEVGKPFVCSKFVRVFFGIESPHIEVTFSNEQPIGVSCVPVEMLRSGWYGQWLQYKLPGRHEFENMYLALDSWLSARFLFSTTEKRTIYVVVKAVEVEDAS